ncbi:flagellar assembly protein FliW [Paenibacillus sp. JX-17]|uniref:Flagellar assembly factor FliW n=1 Tax=Paenibacillus lacisoli TaxID=3064525 RepID=A0ABT9CCF5_9BACL|nr:flagellar assembly protein FliW [Paenibacillus sp. JX-17]MDO7906565.1 flagellar assembly protein FliW [Paenibacillus sp. JX-17]
MIIETSSWGNIEVAEEQVFRFDKGIPGFESYKQFALLEMGEEPFGYLQSVEDKDVSFMLADPFVFYPDYEFELPDSEADELGIDEQIVIRNVLTIREPLEQSTVNLLAPLVLNPIKRTAKQIVLNQSNYQTGHLLWKSSPSTTKGDK